MVYAWDDKEAECYQLYVEEKKPLDEVMRVLKEKYAFNASKRAFQTQFRRWDFPSKQNPAHKNVPLVARIKELWDVNTGQKEMLRLLAQEGFDIKERELMRVRAKNRWLLRVPNGYKGQKAETPTSIGKRKREESAQMDDVDSAGLRELERALNAENAADKQDTEVEDSPSVEREDSVDLSPEIMAKRRQRLHKLQLESAERWATKKRRRRTRGWAGLPADPPGPPRFPSETTLDESKAYLHLDNNLYRELREQFQRICEEAGFQKKTVAGPENWQAAKSRLVAENAHLQNQFHGMPDGVPNESKSIALDVVCTDVTKRMRTLERRMTIAEAKNLLTLNPEESRTIRDRFYDILKADHFTSKLEAGGDHWEGLKRDWIASSSLLQRILDLPKDDPELVERHKALEVLCRDVMKRLRDDQTKKDPSRKRQVNNGPGPGPAPPKVTSTTPRSSSLYAPTASMIHERGSNSPQARTLHDTPLKHKSKQQHQRTIATGDLQIDPSLLAAAALPDLPIDQLQQYAFEGQDLAAAAAAAAAVASSSAIATTIPLSAQSNPHLSTAITTHPHHPHHLHGLRTPPISHQQQQSLTTKPTAVFFRLSSTSPLQAAPAIWLGTLTSATFAAVRALATREHGGSSVVLAGVEGVVTDRDGYETTLPIEKDDEVAAFLQYVAQAKGKATFSVRLVDGGPGFAG